jgi:hypothetical protein
MWHCFTCFTFPAKLCIDRDRRDNSLLGNVTTQKGYAGMTKTKTKTYNRRDSQMVTHSSTSRPVQCLCMAERTGCPVFTDLWSYVLLKDN